MNKKKKIKAYFTLLEVMIAIGILAVFLYLCSNTMLSTLTMKEQLEEYYSKNKVKSTGWHILYQDLSNAVGVYYLDGTDWAGIPKKPAKGAKVKKGKKKGPTMMTMELFEYISDPGGGEPFLGLIVSKGRMGVASEPDSLGFKLIKYYLDDTPIEGAEGQVIYRVESIWKENDEEDAQEEEAVDFVESYRSHIVIENVRDVTHSVYSGTEWLDEWSSTEMGDLPIALKITYTEINDEKDAEFDEEYHDRVIPLPLSYQIIGEPVDEN